MDPKELIQNLENKMEKSINALHNELNGLRVGRASVNLLQPIKVDAHGTKMSLLQVATPSVIDARTLSIQVWDKSNVKAVEKAIINSDLGITPMVSDQVIKLTIPLPSEERRKELVKSAQKSGENARIAIRNIRQEGMDKFKKAEKNSDISKDQLHNLSKEVQKLTDEYIKNIDKLVSIKEQEIMNI